MSLSIYLSPYRWTHSAFLSISLFLSLRWVFLSPWLSSSISDMLSFLFFKHPVCSWYSSISMSFPSLSSCSMFSHPSLSLYHLFHSFVTFLFRSSLFSQPKDCKKGSPLSRFYILMFRPDPDPT